MLTFENHRRSNRNYLTPRLQIDNRIINCIRQISRLESNFFKPLTSIQNRFKITRLPADFRPVKAGVVLH